MMALLVDRHVERMRTSGLSNGALRGVVAHVADVEAGLLHHRQVRIGLEHGDVGRVRVGHHVAFAGLQLLDARRSDRG